MKVDLNDFESLLLEWVQEYHDGRDEIETVYVLIGLGEDQFKAALEGLQARSLVVVEGKEMAVTKQGLQVWETLHGPAYRAQQAKLRLQQLIKAGTNGLVCGGNRKHRRQAIELAAINFLLGDRLLMPKPEPDIDLELEVLGKRKEELVVVFYDAHRIPSRLMWAIRSVAQHQRNVIYIFEGSDRNKMIDMVARYDAAFYQQLTIVDLARKTKS